MKAKVEIEMDIPEEVASQATIGQLEDAIANQYQLKNEIDINNPLNEFDLTDCVARSSIKLVEA